MRIPVPEVDERFDCLEDALEHVIRLSGVIVDKAIKLCPSPTVADIPSYALAFIRKEYEPYVGEYTMEDVRKMVPGLFE